MGTIYDKDTLKQVIAESYFYPNGNNEITGLMARGAMYDTIESIWDYVDNQILDQRIKLTIDSDGEWNLYEEGKSVANYLITDLAGSGQYFITLKTIDDQNNLKHNSKFLFVIPQEVDYTVTFVSDDNQEIPKDSITIGAGQWILFQGNLEGKTRVLMTSKFKFDKFEQADIETKHSITKDETDDDKLKLVNDNDTPGNQKLYGTDADGIKGWYEQPDPANFLEWSENEW